MFISQDSSYIPNLLNQPTSNDTDIHKPTNKPFSEATNRIINRLKNKNHKNHHENTSKQHENQQKQNDLVKMERRNILIDFDLEYDQDDIEESEIVQTYNQRKIQNINNRLQNNQMAEIIDQAQSSAAEFIRPIFNSKKNVLLEFQQESEDQKDAVQPKNPQIGQSSQKRAEVVCHLQDQDIITDNQGTGKQNNEQEDEQDDEQEEEESQEQQTYVAKTRLYSLAKQISQVGLQYYLQAIPKYKMLQIVIKRQKQKDGLKYHIFDTSSLFNFMTIAKDQDGYIFINKINIQNNKKYNVVAKLVSNFFGTEFNCYSMDAPYNSKYHYGCSSKTHRNQITIQYETNILGLRGPRKMTAYIHKNKDKSVVNKSSLNEIYQSQKKKKLPKTVDRFKNKTPKWNNQIGSFVLNFHGRATESSIKNFIMIHENQNDEDDDKLLFGKYGKEIFNLDICHPFNIIQALSLAMSSFDKKIACQ